MKLSPIPSRPLDHSDRRLFVWIYFKKLTRYHLSHLSHLSTNCGTTKLSAEVATSHYTCTAVRSVQCRCRLYPRHESPVQNYPTPSPSPGIHKGKIRDNCSKSFFKIEANYSWSVRGTSTSAFPPPLSPLCPLVSFVFKKNYSRFPRPIPCSLFTIHHSAIRNPQ
jgi:hypothetical protein